MYLENDDQSEDKNDSELCNIALSEEAEKSIIELNSMHGEAKKKILELIEQLKQDKLKDHEIKQVLFSRVNFVSRRTLYNALPPELKREYTKKLIPIPPETISIPITHKVIDQPEVLESQPITSESTSSSEDERKFQEQIAPFENEEPVIESEDPKDIQIHYLKETVRDLEDALRKSQPFKPATEIPETTVSTENLKENTLALTDETVFQYLRDRSKVTGDIVVIDRVGSGALVQVLAQYKGSFGVAELFLRILK